MPTPSCRLILGSASPRRRELLRHSWLPFETDTSDAEELSDERDPEKYALELAMVKARNVLEKSRTKHSFPVVIGSDTVVASEGKILEKPADREEAKRILLSLSGKPHYVFTAVCIAHPKGEVSFAVKTEVVFDHIPEDLLEKYLDTGESMDKAGAYGIQGAALAFIDRVEGSYSSVVGLPLNRTLKELERISKELYPNERDWRSCFE